MNAIRKMFAGVMAMNWFWKVWIALLAAVNVVIPLILFDRPESRWVLIAVSLGFFIGIVLTEMQGFTKLLGLMHIFWFPLIPYLWGRCSEVEPYDFYGFWLRAIIIINTVSLMIDITDVIRYFRGNRHSLV